MFLSQEALHFVLGHQATKTDTPGQIPPKAGRRPTPEGYLDEGNVHRIR